ncbi:MAG: hypothetical protein HY518_04855 [Candidatus Aenigmarchaeota archaeon]|nr:hypothetical protein [Candidatus Aenigmarchaeota archaeon]
MARTPKLLGLERSALGGLKDYYETIMLDMNIMAGIDGRQAVFNLAARGLGKHKVVGETVEEREDGTWECYRVERDNYLLNTGLEQALAFLDSWEMNDDLIRIYARRGLSFDTLKYFENNRRLIVHLQSN